jgi:hypothetical protein
MAYFDALFTTNRKMIIYIGRRTCPDCTYAFDTFMIPYLKTNPNLPPIYGLGVLDNEVWLTATGNNTLRWSDFKKNYDMDNQLNTRLGYATGFVTTFMYIETNGQSIQENPLIIKDMIVTYNDSSLLNPTHPFDAVKNLRTTRITHTFFDGKRPLAYKNLNLTNQLIAEHNSTDALREILKPYHNQALAEFFSFYITNL